MDDEHQELDEELPNSNGNSSVEDAVKDKKETPNKQWFFRV